MLQRYRINLVLQKNKRILSCFLMHKLRYGLPRVEAEKFKYNYMRANIIIFMYPSPVLLHKC